jgi:Acetyltransferase (GNAT) domain
MSERCRVDELTDVAQWEALFARVEHPHMMQAWAYGEAKVASGGWKTRRVVFDAGGWRPRRLVFERDGDPVAIAQLLDKPLAGISCASRLNRGPLFLDAAPDPAVVGDVFRLLRRHGPCQRRGVLLLAPALLASEANHRLLADLGYHDTRRAGRSAIRLDLGQDEEQLRRSLASPWRNRLRAAERAGLVLHVSHDPADVEWMIEHHVLNMRDKGFSGPSPALLRALHRAAPDDVFVFQARLDGEPLGGTFAFRFGHVTENFVGWFGPEGRKVNVGNFLYYHTALELKRLDCRWFDIGGGEHKEKFGRFKQGMRGQEYELLNEWLAL